MGELAELYLSESKISSSEMASKTEKSESQIRTFLQSQAVHVSSQDHHTLNLDALIQTSNN